MLGQNRDDFVFFNIPRVNNTKGFGVIVQDMRDKAVDEHGLKVFHRAATFAFFRILSPNPFRGGEGLGTILVLLSASGRDKMRKNGQARANNV